VAQSRRRAVDRAIWNTGASVSSGEVPSGPLAEKAVSLAPGRAQLLDTLAMALAANNQLPQALELHRRTLKLAPQDPQLKMTLARLFIQAGSKAEARAELEDLAKLGANFPEQAEVAELLKQV
jgi:Flp pilus assembly protein TadD